jgi:hypothetical protein
MLLTFICALTDIALRQERRKELALAASQNASSRHSEVTLGARN